MLATEHYDSPEPVNLGAGFEISIRDLAEKIRALVGYTGQIRWDATKPNGQPRRSLDVSRAENAFGFKATTGFDEGLARTIAWYLDTGRASQGGLLIRIVARPDDDDRACCSVALCVVLGVFATAASTLMFDRGARRFDVVDTQLRLLKGEPAVFDGTRRLPADESEPDPGAAGADLAVGAGVKPLVAYTTVRLLTAIAMFARSGVDSWADDARGSASDCRGACRAGAAPSSRRSTTAGNSRPTFLMSCS